MKPPIASTKQVAEILNVTESHVRLMARRGMIPQPVTLGPRHHLWVRSHIEVIAAKQTHSLVFESLPTPTSPLTKRLDTTGISVPHDGGRAPVHVRTYMPPDDSYEIVVVGFMAESRPLIRTDTAEIVEAVLPMTTMQFDRTQWVFLRPQEFVSRHDITAPTFVYGDRTKHLSGRSRLRPVHMPLASGSSNISFDDLRETLAHAPEWYPAHGYTLDVVSHWQRKQHPKPVLADEQNILPLINAARTLDSVSAADPHRPLADDAIRVLLDELHEREVRPMRFHFANTVPDSVTTMACTNQQVILDDYTLPKATTTPTHSSIAELLTALDDWKLDQHDSKSASTRTLDEALTLTRWHLSTLHLSGIAKTWLTNDPF